MTSKKHLSADAEVMAMPAVQGSIIESVAPVPSTESGEKVIHERIGIKQPARLWVIVLLLGWVFDFLFWKQSVGVNFVLFLAFCLLGGLSLLLVEGYKPSRNSLWLLMPLAFFAGITFIRQESLTIFLAYVFTLFSIGLFATSYLGGRWHLYRLFNYFHKFFLVVIDMVARPAEFFHQTQKEASEPGKARKSLPLAGIIRGLFIALPIVICFGALLASADVVFSQKINDLFDSEKIFEYIQRFFLIIIFAYGLAGIFLHAATRSRDEKITQEDKSVIKPFLGFTEAAVVLGSVSLLFLTFVVVQFQYFFGGETNIGVAGYTYSQYARRGFNELVIVAFFSLVMILGLSTVTRREDETQKKVYSGLSVGVVGLVMVILLSAYQRISLAIDWHGFSRLRIYPRVFLVWLGILLITVVVLEIFHRERYFAFATVIASLGFAVSLPLVNVDAAIVNHNVPRVLQGKNLNVAHLASLSTDAVPALVEEYQSGLYSQSVHEGLGAALVCYWYAESRPDGHSNDWRSFNISRWRAHVALQKVQSTLMEYRINDKRWPARARTPGNVLYECYYYDSGTEE